MECDLDFLVGVLAVVRDGDFDEAGLLVGDFAVEAV